MVDLLRRKRIVTSETRLEMKKILEEIQTGEFTKEWATENNAGRPMLNRLRAIEARSSKLKRLEPSSENYVDFKNN